MSDELSPSDVAVLGQCPPVAELPDGARQRLFAAVQIRTVRAGDNILTQGTVGDAFYVLLEGTVEVSKDGGGKTVELAELQPGAYFGEQALSGKTSGLRTATVRAVSECRIAAVTAEVFDDLVAASGQNRDRFESDAATYLYREITRSLDSFLATELSESEEGAHRLRFAKGQVLMQEGERSDSAFLILSGTAVFYKTINGERRDVARMGTGQIFGELGVLNDEPRAATGVADSDMEVLRIFKDAFVRWHRAHPHSSGFFNSLSQVYKLSQGRQMSVFLGELGGERTVTSIVGRPTDGVVSTRVLDQGVVVFTNAGASAVAGERAVMKYADDRIKRELRVIVKERKGDRIERCIVYAVAAEGIENDLGTLYQNVLHLDEVQAVALRRFEHTGFLGGKAERSERLCPCLGLGSSELAAAVHELGADYATLRANVGVGSICGGCERAVRSFLVEAALAEPRGATSVEPRSFALDTRLPSEPGVTTSTDPAIADVPQDLLTRDEKQCAALLARAMGPELTSVTREQLAVRLRASDVRDMSSFIDLLFPGAFTISSRATPAALAAALGRGIGFGRWRQAALRPVPFLRAAMLEVVRGVDRLGRAGMVMSLLTAAVVSLVVSPAWAGPFWTWFAALLVASGVALSLRPSGRFLRMLVVGGPTRFYRALFSVFGREEAVAVLRLTPFGKPTYIVRDERLVDYILQNPHIYARKPLTGNPAFAEFSVLGGGSDGVWLGYRMLCEEYFAEGYREDLELIRDIVRERVRMWEGRDSIDLLREIYRVVVETRARVFFQTSFDCFVENAAVDYPGIVDRALSASALLFGDSIGREADTLRRRALEAVRGATRSSSIGGILLDAWQAGDIDEREACENAVMYILAQAPTMGIFWTLYRSAYEGHQTRLRGNRREIVKAIKEELRLHAPVTSMFRRQVLRDDGLGEIPVKAGSMIILSPMYIHTNERHWTAPFEYDPERWTSSVGDGKEIVEPKTDPSDSRSRPEAAPQDTGAARYVPFGGGAQACQGRWFAADEMLIVVEEILKSYELRILDDQGLLAKPLPEQVMFHVYNRPFNDVRMRPVRMPAS